MKHDTFSFTAVFIEVPEGGFSAYIEEIPGVNSEGESLEEARFNLQEALKMVLETNKILAQKNLIQGAKSYREPLLIAK